LKYAFVFKKKCLNKLIRVYGFKPNKDL
jgi:hypothetical protein